MKSTKTLKYHKIIVFDNVISGNNHLVINSGIIQTAHRLLESANGNGNVDFLGEISHINELSQIINLNEFSKVSFWPIKVVLPSKSGVNKVIMWFKKLASDRKNILELYLKSKGKDSKLIIISTMISFNLFWFFYKFKNLNENDFLIFIHGEVEFLFKENRSTKEKFNSFFLEKALTNLPHNARLIVFSELLKKMLLQKFNYKQNQIICVNHPIRNYTRINNEISKCKTFSHFGVANKRKNSQVIFKLSEDFTSSIAAGYCKFSIIGRLEEHEIKKTNANVVIESINNETLNNDVYWSLINKTDYSLIFLTDDEYVYRVSGSLLDSIQFQIPIIALKQSYVSELFEKGGDIGFICKDIEEMIEVVKQINSENPIFINRYTAQVVNLKNLSSKYHFENAASEIKSNLLSDSL